MAHDVHIIGGGLAGSEAAWQLARRGVKVRLSEMRGAGDTTPAHQTEGSRSARRSGSAPAGAARTRKSAAASTRRSAPTDAASASGPSTRAVPIVPKSAAPATTRRAPERLVAAEFAVNEWTTTSVGVCRQSRP